LDFLIILSSLPVSYAIHGLLGGVLYVLVQKYGFSDKAEIVRRLGIGAIAGYIVFTMGLPDSFTALSMGYLGIDAIEGLITKIQTKK